MTPDTMAPPPSIAARGHDDSDRFIDGVHDFYRAFLAPGSGTIRGIREVSADSAGRRLCFIGDQFGDAPSMPASGVLYRVDGVGGAPVALIRDPVGLPRLSPDGLRLVHVISGPGGDTLILTDIDARQAAASVAVAGRIEDVAWSPSGARVLLRVAGLSADHGGRDGGVMRETDRPDGAPILSPADDADLWRRVWITDFAAAPRCVSASRETVWEACWCGEEAIVIVRSPDHSENAWYDADLALIDLCAGHTTTLYTPTDQIGLPAASDDGQRIAFVEAVCSDRGLVCGDLFEIDRSNGNARAIDTAGVDVSSVAYRRDGTLHYAGLRSLETVVGDIARDGAPRELWCSANETSGPWHPVSLPIGDADAVMVREGPLCPPTLSRLRHGAIEDIVATGDDALALAARIELRATRWTAPDGLEIDGLILTPRDRHGPYPVLMEVHGGPVLAHRPRWPANVRTAWLVLQGYAVFHPNPRGSCGHGRAFAGAVRGDMGGADAADLLAGLDHLVSIGVADPERLAVTGSSYGGYIAAWLVTQTDRFRASIAISPISDWTSQHGTSQIGRFDTLFLADPALRLERSPVHQAQHASTPTLLLAGARDRNTPAGQAQQFHTALLDHGVPSVFALYPAGGHSLRDFSILCDVSARTAGWLAAHMR